MNNIVIYYGVSQDSSDGCLGLFFSKCSYI